MARLIKLFFCIFLVLPCGCEQPKNRPVKVLVLKKDEIQLIKLPDVIYLVVGEEKMGGKPPVNDLTEADLKPFMEKE